MTHRSRIRLAPSSRRLCGGLALAVALGAASGADAVGLGQIDTFEDGTTQGWIVAWQGSGLHPAPPVAVASGGPAGADDGHLRLTAIGGEGPGSRLVVINPAQWAGDYLAAGIGAIRMDVINLGASDLALRLLFEDSQAGPPTNLAISTAPVLVPSGSGWLSIEFPVAPESLTAVLGSVDGALSGATALRLYHGAAPAFPGETLTASLGIDNVHAVPEPAGATLTALALGTLALRRRPPGGPDASRRSRA